MYNQIENYLFSALNVLERTTDRNRAYADLAPLTWYISTGRAPTEFIKLLLQKKPYLIARRLQQGGSYQEVIDRICQFLHYRRENF